MYGAVLTHTHGVCACRYINFGALCMNFLEVSKDYAELTDPDRADGYDAPISAIQSLMSVLTFGLLLSFGGIGFKKAYIAARSTSLGNLRTRASSFWRTRGDSAAAPGDGPNEVPGGFGGLTARFSASVQRACLAARSTSWSELRARVRSLGRSRGGPAPPSEAPRHGSVDEETFGGLNPICSAGAAASRRVSKAARRDLAVELTDIHAGKATKRTHRGHQLSVESSETMALPAPPAVAAPTLATSVLPAEWAAHTTPEGKVYYYNAATGVTAWTLPEAGSFEIGGAQIGSEKSLS